MEFETENKLTGSEMPSELKPGRKTLEELTEELAALAPKILEICRYKLSKFHGPNLKTDAQDLAQEVMAQALLNLNAFSDRNETGLISWIDKIAQNRLVYDWRQRHVSLYANRAVESLEVADSRPNPLEELLNNSSRLIFYQALQSLPEAERKLIEPMLEGLSIKKIADQLQMSEIDYKQKRRFVMSKLLSLVSRLQGLKSESPPVKSDLSFFRQRLGLKETESVDAIQKQILLKNQTDPGLVERLFRDLEKKNKQAKSAGA